MAQINITLDTELLHGLFTKESKEKSFSKLLEAILNQVLLSESAEQLKAEPYERSESRTAYRNGFRNRDLTTRIGTITLRVPRHRDGDFSTDMFYRYQRSEQALVLAMIEMVLNGVSTRKIERITEELCGATFSKSTVSNMCKHLDPLVEGFKSRKLSRHYPFVIVDAMYVKVREENRVRSKGLLIATAVNEAGNREVIGFNLSDSESESSWSDLFCNLKDRGLSNIDFVVSDNHKGLVNAVKKHFQGATWQRCQTHFSRNVLDNTPKKLQPEMKKYLKSIYNAANIKDAREQMRKAIDKFEMKASKAIEILELGFDDVTAIFALPEKYQKRLRTTNSIERLNEEVRRRDRVIRIYPNKESANRLLGAILMELDEKWLAGRKYLDMDLYYQSMDKYTERKIAV